MITSGRKQTQGNLSTKLLKEFIPASLAVLLIAGCDAPKRADIAEMTDKLKSTIEKATQKSEAWYYEFEMVEVSPRFKVMQAQLNEVRVKASHKGLDKAELVSVAYAGKDSGGSDRVLFVWRRPTVDVEKNVNTRVAEEQEAVDATLRAITEH
jgi:hypothetical protein